MDRTVVDALDYWLNYFMTCSPSDPQCDSFAQFYPQAGGTGNECGYVAFPPPVVTVPKRLLSQGAIAAVAVGIILVIAIPLVLWHAYNLRKQRRRYKKRFVQQIARNIQIGPTPREIPAEKLAEEIQHISSRQNGIINKEDLQKWMFDIKLNFLSDKDFDALWNAIDVDGRGVVEPLEFFVFLSLCGPEFESVHQEISGMPKGERLKWATRRLTNYKLRGEVGVRKMEHDLERRARQNVAFHRGAMLGNATATSGAQSAQSLHSHDSSASSQGDSQPRDNEHRRKRARKWLPGLAYGPPIEENITPTEFLTTYNRSPAPSLRSSLSSARSTTAPTNFEGGTSSDTSNDHDYDRGGVSFFPLDAEFVREDAYEQQQQEQLEEEQHQGEGDEEEGEQQDPDITYEPLKGDNSKDLASKDSKKGDNDDHNEMPEYLGRASMMSTSSEMTHEA